MGVKSLWTLLDPVGRPVPLETMEGKSMAIDSSIWIYQFQATMRDKEGRGLVNAHVLGFLRRICKLLFYGIKPVFVFDGGAPALKRATISERKKKKSGAALSHAKVAERLLAAQMRREALNQVKTKSGSTGKGKVPEGPVVINENTVYLEDVDDSLPKTPSKKIQKGVTEPTPPSSRKKSRWHDHDPYKLPDVNLDEAIANATRSMVPDPRLATEDELRAFIEEMRPEDFDVTSPEFRELPTEVQYEIVGDLRLKSRQMSYKRLQNMLRNAKTPLDFSKEQIKNLKHRNALTQQLLITTDTIGKANVTIPIRIASERNKEYVLVKNEGNEGGWVLGIRDEGTQSKPIEVDPGSDKEDDQDSNADMEEVAINDKPVFDPEMREFRRGQALAALANRYSPKKLAPLTSKASHKPKNVRPLFAPDEEELHQLPPSEDDNDHTLALIIQKSLDEEEASQLRQALEASKAQFRVSSSEFNAGASTSCTTLSDLRPSTPEQGASSRDHDVRTPIRQTNRPDSDDELYTTPVRLETALSIANVGSARRSSGQINQVSNQSPSMFGVPSLLLPSHVSPPAPVAVEIQSDSEENMEEVSFVHSRATPVVVAAEAIFEGRVFPEASVEQLPEGLSSDSDDDVWEVPSTLPVMHTKATSPVSRQETSPQNGSPLSESVQSIRTLPPSRAVSLQASIHGPRDNETSLELGNDGQVPPDSDEVSDPWDQPVSSTADPSGSTLVPAESTGDSWDAAEEMDPQAEEGEFARFISQVKGKDINAVRREIDEEIRDLHQQRKAAMRDSEDITQQMVSQIMIMLRLFGIPYITAPMEAEAQCAELLTLGLVDGIITDDSDVFLFGGLRVLKNMFNQSKTVECYLLADLERELGLDRDKLIRLAYLLGSDYTDGLPGVGPVVAMELLKEFPGQDGLHKFKHWWQKVQGGKDTATDTNTSFRKRFKKRFKDLYLPDDWPNPAVRDAYYHPTADESEDPFKWGLPDLDALRDFFNSELGWHQSKVDELLLPIIRKMGKRGQSSVAKQGSLTSFFDVPLGGAAPRKRQAYASRRLQQVVSDFRKERVMQQSAESSAASGEEDATIGSDSEVKEKPAKRRKTTAAKGKGKEGTLPTSKRSSTAKGKRGRSGKAKQARKRQASGSAGECEDVEVTPAIAGSPPPPLSVNLRPRPKPAYRGAQGPTTSDEEGEI